MVQCTTTLVTNWTGIRYGVTYPLNGAYLRNKIALQRLRSKSVGGKPAARNNSQPLQKTNNRRRPVLCERIGAGPWPCFLFSDTAGLVSTATIRRNQLFCIPERRQKAPPGVSFALQQISAAEKPGESPLRAQQSSAYCSRRSPFRKAESGRQGSGARPRCDGPAGRRPAR
jgi:hypothetical protein